MKVVVGVVYTGAGYVPTICLHFFVGVMGKGTICVYVGVVCWDWFDWVCIIVDIDTLCIMCMSFVLLVCVMGGVVGCIHKLWTLGRAMIISSI